MADGMTSDVMVFAENENGNEKHICFAVSVIFRWFERLGAFFFQVIAFALKGQRC